MSHRSKAAEYLTMADQKIQACTVRAIPYSSGKMMVSLTPQDVQYVQMLTMLAQAHQAMED